MNHFIRGYTYLVLLRNVLTDTTNATVYSTDDEELIDTITVTVYSTDDEELIDTITVYIPRMMKSC
jgi:hypothetical protein